MTLNCCPDAPLEPPAPTQEQERVNRIIYSIEKDEKKLSDIKDEFEEIKAYFADIKQFKFLQFNYLHKFEQMSAQIMGSYESEICRLEENVSDMKTHLIDLGYAPD